MPIRKISHITHNKEADSIMKTTTSNFTFNATRRVGRDYRWDGTPIGESFRYSPLPKTPDLPPKSPYMFIKPGQSLMAEGNYSWWGVQFDPEYTNKDRSYDFEKFRSNDNRCPTYLKHPASSSYGNNEFSGKLTDILNCYRNSRNPETLPDTYLLPGGTLYYSHEICYVIIVCIRDDLSQVRCQISASEKSSEPVVSLCGLVDENYKIIDYTGSKIPQLSFSFLSTDERWENLAFAFYFPENSNKQLSCPKKIIVKRSDIEHKWCIKKMPGSLWICPNNMSGNKVQSKVTDYFLPK